MSLFGSRARAVSSERVGRLSLPLERRCRARMFSRTRLREGERWGQRRASERMGGAGCMSLKKRERERDGQTALASSFCLRGSL